MHSLMMSVVAVAALAVVVRAADTTQPAATQPFSSQYQTASYGIGYDLGRNIKDSHVALDGDLIVQGLRDSLAGVQTKVTPDQFAAAMQQVQQEMQKNAAVANKAAGDSASKDGDAFRAENGKKPGVKTTASGLQIETITEGTGPTPTATEKVKVNYAGMLTSGQKFDSSTDHGGPAEFPVNGVIAGWTEALQLMKVGGKVRLVVPPEIAYGAAGAPPSIPPNSTLVFEVELLAIEK